MEDYEYRGLIAGAWDLLRGDTSRWADRFFYKEIIAQNGQPVLDVGCGTGRLLLDYLAGGIDIDGVDNSPEMLDLCREKAGKLGLRPALFQQTMPALNLPRRYRAIIVPSSSFQLLIDRDEARAAMQRFYEHLQPGGVLVMPFMILWRDAGAAQFVIEGWRRTERPWPERGVLVRRWTRSLYDIAEHIEHSETEFEVIRDGQTVAAESHSRSPATRGYTQQQAVKLYQEAGFTDLRVFKEFTFEPAQENDWIFTIVGARPAAA